MPARTERPLRNAPKKLDFDEQGRCKIRNYSLRISVIIACTCVFLSRDF